MKKATKLFALLIIVSTAMSTLASCGVAENIFGEKHTHKYGEWIKKSTPTCTDSGEWIRYCECGEKQTENFPAIGHSFVNGICSACSEKENDEKICYTVTVVDQHGNLVDGVSVEFVADPPLTWKAKNGVAQYTTAKEVTAAIITKIPAGYSYDNLGKELHFDSTANIKVTLTSNKAPVSVKIVDQYGKAVAGVLVQVCETGEGGSCVGLGETDENGVATKVIKNADYKAQITILPEGYTVEDITAYYPLENGEVTIVVTKDTAPTVKPTGDFYYPTTLEEGTFGYAHWTIFEDEMVKGTATSPIEIANAIVESGILPFMAGVMEIEVGTEYFTGFDNYTIEGYKSAAVFMPMIGSIPYVGYIFELKDGVDVYGFIDDLAENCNPRWNICVTADETLVGACGNTVFFLMCPISIE